MLNKPPMKKYTGAFEVFLDGEDAGTRGSSSGGESDCILDTGTAFAAR